MRSDPIHPAELGGTLFIPATHPGLAAVMRGEKYPQLRSAVIDFEDGINAKAPAAALTSLIDLLPTLAAPSLLRFIRPASPALLKEMLRREGIGNIDGFILPKFGLENIDTWLSPLQNSSFAMMPSIEGAELFCPRDLTTLADMLRPYRKRIPVVRFGLEDMLRQLGIARGCDRPLYSLVAPAQIIGTLIAAFKPQGYHISGGVYRCYRDGEGFRAEVEEDLKQGLLSKTIIHPSQIDVIEEVYKVTRNELQQAEAILNTQNNVSALHGIMLEKPTQTPWAETILKRAALYGVMP